MANVEKSVPHNIEAEEAVLGALLIDPESAFRVRSFLRGEDFYLKKHQWVYDALVAVSRAARARGLFDGDDGVGERGQIGQVGGAAYIPKLMNAVPSAINIAAYGHIVEEAAVRRRLLDSVSDIARFAYHETMAIEPCWITPRRALWRLRAPADARAATGAGGGPRYYDRIEYLYEHRGEPLGVPRASATLTPLLGGFQRSDFLILAAAAGVGKTSLMISMALNAAALGKRVAIFSLEMSRSS